MPEMFKNRLKQLEELLVKKKLDSFIVTNSYNIHYLTGFRGGSDREREAILILCKKSILIVPRIYKNEAKSLNDGVQIIIVRGSLLKSASNLLKVAKKIGFEENDLKFSEYQFFKKTLHRKTFIAVSDLIEKIRSQKSDYEIENIKKAQQISHKAFDKLIPLISKGKTEKELAEKLAQILAQEGAGGLAFESIVAFGPNAAKPHHQITNQKIVKGQVLLFDFGAKFKGYCADTSRTIFFGRAKDEIRKIYYLVQEAQKMAIAQVKADMPASKVHQASAQVFKKYRLEKFFIHSIGHGIGLEVHEHPHLNPKSDDMLEERMVFSIEPGLYFPWGGIRIEDLIVIENGKPKILGNQVAGLIEI